MTDPASLSPTLKTFDDTFSLDFETVYDKGYSLKQMPAWAYCFDARFDAYLLSVAGPNNYLWVGHPKDFDWTLLTGKTITAHNFSFDGLVIKRLQQDGIIPEFHPKAMHCSADLSSFLKLPRALKDIARFIFGDKEVAATGKAVRERMKGMRAADMQNDPEILTYAANDALLCRRLWVEYSHLWPEEEREISRIGREQGWVGVKIDMPYVNDCVERLQLRLFEAAKDIPWEYPDGKTPLSRNKMIEEAQKTIDEERLLSDDELMELQEYRKTLPNYNSATSSVLDLDNSEVTEILNKFWNGEEDLRRYPCKLFEGEDGYVQLRKYMWYPASFAKDDDECEAWEDSYSGRFSWIASVRIWRRLNMILQKFQHLQKYTSEDGRYRVQLRYCGAHTGRWSGAAGFNVQNLPRGEMFHDKFYPAGSLDKKGNDVSGEGIPGTGYDLRRCLLGNFYITDYAQIEARGLVALAKDERILPKLRAGMSIYQAHAEATTGQTWKNLKKENFPLYMAKKVEVLLLGYQGGAEKTASTAYKMTRDSKDPAGVVNWTPEQALEVVRNYRTNNPITGIWERLDRCVKQSAMRSDECLEINLPSGRVLRYWNPRMRKVTRIVKGEDGKDKLVERVSVFTQHAKNDPSSYRSAFGGNMTENVVSGMCRDVLRDGWLALYRAGYHCRLHGAR